MNAMKRLKRAFLKKLTGKSGSSPTRKISKPSKNFTSSRPRSNNLKKKENQVSLLKKLRSPRTILASMLLCGEIATLPSIGG